MVKKLVLTICLLLIASNCFGAELYIFNEDIICVREDGHKWSRAELPKVVKKPSLSLKDAKKYEKSADEVYAIPDTRLEDFFTPTELMIFTFTKTPEEVWAMHDNLRDNVVTRFKVTNKSKNNKVSYTTDRQWGIKIKEAGEDKCDEVDYEMELHGKLQKIKSVGRIKNIFPRRYKFKDGKIIDKLTNDIVWQE